MDEVIVVGAGLAGLVAAINCARSGHKVTVFEKEKQVGGAAHIRPAVDVTPMDREALAGFIGIELKEPQVVPTEEFILYIYGKRYSIPGPWLHLHSVERGSRKTSLDQYLYKTALDAGVKFEFGAAIEDQEQYACLPFYSIIATGLTAEPFHAMRRPALNVYGHIARGTEKGAPRMIAFFDRDTKYYRFFANQNGVAFGLGCDAAPVEESLRDEWNREMEEREGWRFKQWLPHEGVVATPRIDSPALFASYRILAGTFAGMQDPFVLFGVHGSLCSGKIAAMAVEDRERAWRLFKDFTSGYKVSWSVKKIFDHLPHAGRNIALRSILSLYGSHQGRMQPFVEFLMRTLPGYGRLPEGWIWRKK